MAEKQERWMQRAFSKASGQLRKKAKAKAGQPIASGKLEKLTHSQSLKTKRQAVLAKTARRYAGK